MLREALEPLFNRYPGLKILTGDAAFAGRELNEAIITLGRDYIVQVKDNQPKLKKYIEEWFKGRIQRQPPAAVEVKKKFVEEKWELWVESRLGTKVICALTDFPGLKQLGCIRRTGAGRKIKCTQRKQSKGGFWGN